jgi:DUF2934 family protein
MAKRTLKSKKATGVTPPSILSTAISHEQVAHKAYELYQQRGAEHGRDLEDWFRAEQLMYEALRADPLPEEPRGGGSNTEVRV